MLFKNSNLEKLKKKLEKVFVIDDFDMANILLLALARIFPECQSRAKNNGIVGLKEAISFNPNLIITGGVCANPWIKLPSNRFPTQKRRIRRKDSCNDA